MQKWWRKFAPQDPPWFLLGAALALGLSLIVCILDLLWR